MKKTFWSLLFVLLVVNVQARNRQNGVTGPVARNAAISSASSALFPGSKPITIGAKGAIATAFYRDTFNVNSLTTGGWVAGGNTPTIGSWKFTASASSGSYSIGPLYSTTAATGWMLYDSDSIGFVFGNAPQIGTLTSPSISCTGHSLVGVRFQESAVRYQDTFLIQASNDNGVTWTSYPVHPNMELITNGETNNPETVLVNITSVAANKPNVKVRFYYSGAYPGGGFNWLVDDFEMVDMDPVDLAVLRSGAVMNIGGGGITPMGTQPKGFVDTITVFTNVANFGGLSQTADTVSAATYFNGSLVSGSGSIVRSVVPINAYDSLTSFNPYKATASGSYVVAFSNKKSGDAVTANNADTLVYNISDSSLCVFSGYIENSKRLNGYYYQGSYALHLPSSGSTPGGASYYQGSIFEIPAGKIDTVTSVNVCIAPNSAVGAQVIAEIYQADFSQSPTAYDLLGTSVIKTLTTADISASTSSLTFTSIPIAVRSGNNKFLILGGGVFAVVVRSVNPGSAQTVRIASASAAAPARIIGRYGVADASTGINGGFGLSGSTGYNEFESVPAIVVNFGNSRALLGVTGVANSVSVGDAYPNPANTTLNIPVTATAATEVSINLSDILGQELYRQDLGVIKAGSSKTAMFNISELAAGTYFYTITANGARHTARVTVAH